MTEAYKVASPPDPAQVGVWRHHLHEEADAAYLYRTLAETEPDEKKKGLYRQLAEVEDRHTGMWRKLLSQHGLEPAIPRPSLRARLMAWAARRFGPSVLLGVLLREEGQEVRGYLDLYKESGAGAVKDAALTLAKESAEHAETLTTIAGAKGEPWHRTESGGFLRNVVYGFNDGLTANFGLVAGVVGASVASHIVMVSGVAGMIADALSMGSSGYLAAKSEREVYAHEIAMEQEEIHLMPDIEEDELALLYEAKGVQREQARRMAHDVMADPRRALDEKVREELRIGEAHTTPLKEGWITGAATAFGAAIPVAPFLLFEGQVAIWTSFAVSMLSHFGVGAARSVFTGRGVIRSGIDMFVVGLGVAGVGYVVGDRVAKWLT
ncbi:MAG: VIT1/CCC1 transporter family protein [Gemmatimonadetes bacterium]|nr:VIT1/CCC1 transporter family protein [Gemmatimonadota bacterium]